jgi:hypothetical protein
MTEVSATGASARVPPPQSDLVTLLGEICGCGVGAVTCSQYGNAHCFRRVVVPWGF